MALTQHQRRHVRAVLADARDILTETERRRVIQAARELLDGDAAWPDPDLLPLEIHDWVEQKPDDPDFRAAIQPELDRRRIARGG